MRTGRASVAMLDTIRVDYYGTPTPLNQVGNLARPRPDAHHRSSPGTPRSSPRSRRPSAPPTSTSTPRTTARSSASRSPPLTEERRKNLVKVAHKHAEEGRVAVRNVRRDANEHLKKLLKEHERQRGRREARPRRGPEAHRPAHRGDQRRPQEEGSRDHGGLTLHADSGSADPRGSDRAVGPSVSVPLLSSPFSFVRSRKAPVKAVWQALDDGLPPAATSRSRSARSSRLAASALLASPRLHREPALRRALHPGPRRRHLHAARRVPARARRHRQGRRARRDPPGGRPAPAAGTASPPASPGRSARRRSTGLHVVVVEALLPSPAAADGDFFRARAPRAQPARNVVSAFVDAEHGVYEYQEVLRDPASPLAAARALSRGRAEAGRGLRRGLRRRARRQGRAAPRESDVRRAYRERLAEPFAREVALLAERPFYGPRERRDLDALFDRIDEKQKDLAARLAALAPGTPARGRSRPRPRRPSTRSARASSRSSRRPGCRSSRPRAATRVRFRATLVMPVADPAREHLRRRRHRDLGVRRGGPLRPRLRDEGARRRALTL